MLDQVHLPPGTTVDNAGAAFNKSAAHFARASGPDLIARTEPYLRWIDARTEAGVWPYYRCLLDAPQPNAAFSDTDGRTAEGLNFASQDYLGLSRHPAVIDAGVDALRRFGPHSASSPCFTGNTPLSVRLEVLLADTLQTQHAMLFTSGWAAGYGIITALVRPDDHVVIDSLAHACLNAGADAATRNIHRHRHCDLDDAEGALRRIRATDSRNAILVITEGLFSMDADSPDLPRLQDLCDRYEATLLVDIAHDFGATGPGGGGQLAIQGMLGKVDLVMGALSKTFASNGGFLACNSRAVIEYVRTFGSSFTFTNAVSPVQAAVAAEALQIVRSAEGVRLRKDLLDAVLALRDEFLELGIRCIGAPSPIVPVPIGNEKVARLASSLLFERGVFANLAEFPAVGVGASRFRMQCMATHDQAQVRTAAHTVAGAIRDAAAAICGGERLEVDAQVPLAVVRDRGA